MHVSQPPHDAVSQSLPAPSSLLTTAEVEAATGLQLKPPAPRDMDMKIPWGPATGQAMRICGWPLGPQDGVILSVGPAGAMDTLLASKPQDNDVARAQGLTIDERTIGNAKCHAITWPSTSPRKTFVTICV